MTSNKPSILIVEDEPIIMDIYRACLDENVYDIVTADCGGDAITALNAAPPDVALLDLRLPDMTGFDILQHIAKKRLPTESIMVTSEGTLNTAVEAMKLGARDFIVKPFEKTRLLLTIENVLESHKLRMLVESFQETSRHAFSGFIGSSVAMQGLYKIVESAAKSKATVFITGESGTGKEVCAEAIHGTSDRVHKPLVPINCGAIPKDLIESEIFGHVKGAFTGAIADRTGAAGMADGGTLFLDEICEMQLDLQPKLLRFLQTGTFNRVGSAKTESVDVRIICATNRDPWQEVQLGRFREDLYYRLFVLPIALPPLRERDNDAIELAQHFLDVYAAEENKQFDGFSADAETLLAGYDWPGNVRELQNTVRSLVVIHESGIIDADRLPPRLQVARDKFRRASATVPNYEESGLGPNAQTVDDIVPLDMLERAHIEHAIKVCGGNISEAAKHLGINQATIYRKKNAWNAAD